MFEHLVLIFVKLLTLEYELIAEDDPLSESDRLWVLMLVCGSEHKHREELVDVQLIVFCCCLLEGHSVSLHRPWVLLREGWSSLRTLHDLGRNLLPVFHVFDVRVGCVEEAAVEEAPHGCVDVTPLVEEEEDVR